MPNRRTFLQSLLSTGTLLATTEASPIAETDCGRLQASSVQGVHVFRGIPYGGPTEGSARFLPPAKPAKWTGIRDATITGPRCVQGPGNIFLSPLIGEYFGGGRPNRTELARQTDSENCLNVNVLTPGLKGKRPVMVYMHGGGLTGGSSALTLFSDVHVREQDIVLVGVNHRLNVFGYTYLGGLSSKYATANVGQLDLIAALQWVQRNIANFGGDPNNVTIFGESGGGAKISALLAMPGAKGLFHKAAVQSGSVLRAGDPDTATAAARKLLANLGLTQADELQHISADKLFAASRNIGQPAVIVDGHSLPHQPWDPTAPELSATIPLIIGCNKDETSLSYTKDSAIHTLTEAGLKERTIAAGIPAADADKLLSLYRRDHPGESPTDIWFRITTDRGTRRNSLRQAERKAEQNRASVFFYYCQWDTPISEGAHKIKAFHTSDLPLTMRLVRFPESEQLSKQLSAAWAAFARTGNPSTNALPWPAFTLKDRATMIFDSTNSHAINDPDRDTRRLLD
ncbi:MAG: carboxylesterase/lipase family protein [Bryobacterales bacterium]|nr:carboxylesterase/lipase family protein [Bryobacterales bacterium]